MVKQASALLEKVNTVKPYQSDRRVQACEMTYGEFVRKPEVEALRNTTHYQDSPGYMVESYEGISAHEGHSGKLRWIPRAEFECTHVNLSAYAHLGDSVMRVAAEKNQLDTKLLALTKFIKGDMFARLPISSRDDLLEQCRYMTQYSMVLDRRMERFQKEYAHKQKKAA